MVLPSKGTKVARTIKRGHLGIFHCEDRLLLCLHLQVLSLFPSFNWIHKLPKSTLFLKSSNSTITSRTNPRRNTRTTLSKRRRSQRRRSEILATERHTNSCFIHYSSKTVVLCAFCRCWLDGWCCCGGLD
jgi:hypothetical protein